MRAGVVRNSIPNLLFFTNRAGVRMITGHYRIAWYAPGPLAPPDYALAADRVHFVRDGLRFDELPEPLCSLLDTKFRIIKRIDAEASATLIDLLYRIPDATGEHISEVRRLENFNRFHTGYTYVNWGRREPFDWSVASVYLNKPSAAIRVNPRTTSMTNTWLCDVCKRESFSRALLKACPLCGQAGSLVPLPG